MKAIMDKWFKKQARCTDLNMGSTYSSPLSLGSLWGLFLIVGVSSALALFIHAAMLFYQNWHILIRSDPELSVWRKICLIFDQRDPNSHAFQARGMQDNDHAIGAVESLPNIMINSSPRPSSHSVYTDSDITDFEIQETLSNSSTHSDVNSSGQAIQETW